MLALERERQAAVDEQRRAAEAHLAELEAERLRQEALAQQLSRTEVPPGPATPLNHDLHPMELSLSSYTCLSCPPIDGFVTNGCAWLVMAYTNAIADSVGN